MIGHMALYVDDIEVDWPGQRLGELLQSATERLEPSGRIIVEVTVAGVPLVGDDLVARREEEVGEQEVRLATADPRELTLSTLAQVREGLEGIRGDQEQAAELFQKDEPAEALKRVGAVLQAWLHVQEAVLHSARLAAIDLDAFDVDGTPVKAMTDNLLEQFTQLKEQLTNGDLVGVADALAYEWPATVDQWDRLLETLIERIGDE